MRFPATYGRAMPRPTSPAPTHAASAAGTSTPGPREALGRQRLLPGQSRLVWASVLVVVGAITPWVATVAGNLLGVQGGGLWTLAAGGVGVASVAFRRRGIVVGHGIVVTVTTLAIAGWQGVHLVRLGCDFRVCAPSFGLVLTLAGGLLAASAVRRLLRDGDGTGR